MENPCFLEDLNWSTKNFQREQLQQQLKPNCYAPNNNNNINQYYQVSKELKKSQSISSQEQAHLYICPVSKAVPIDASSLSSGQYSEKKPSGISIIYQPHCLVSRCGEDVKEVIRSTKLKKEWCPSGWRLQFVENKSGVTTVQKIATVFCALILATIITLFATGAVLYVLRNVHPSSVVGGSKRSTWFGVDMISGEFHITNKNFMESLADRQSIDFKKMSSTLTSELDRLYLESILSEEYQSSVVTLFTPVSRNDSKQKGLVVLCSLAFSTDLTPGRVGEAFLGGLQHLHGNGWLGNFSIDLQSIGFEPKVEEVSWSSWSEWSECKRLPDKFVQMRNRSCILNNGLQLSRVDPCLLLDTTSNVDTVECTEFIKSSNTVDLSTADELQNATESAHLLNDTLDYVNINSTSRDSDNEINKIQQYELTTESTFTGGSELSERNNYLEITTAPMKKDDKFIKLRKQPQLNEQGEHVVYDFSKNERRQCGLCVKGEVCVALKDDAVPYCVPIIDPNDPTGCGGHCKINVEICQRLQKEIYRCVDNKQCFEDEWQCSNRLCIPLSKRCDGYFNCYDNTDEINCECNLKTHFHCGDRLSCLPNKKRCDGIVDCWDAADEVNCTKDCFGQFTCNDSQCILSHQFCDGYPDCADHSDEPFGCGGECKKNEFKCKNNRCISKRNVCNGEDNCGDRSDEESCANSR